MIQSMLRFFSSLSLLPTLFVIFVFYLPFQISLHSKWVKALFTKWFQAGDLPLYLEKSFCHNAHLTLSSLVALALLAVLLRESRDFFRKIFSLGTFFVLSLVSVIFSANGGNFWPYVAWFKLALALLLGMGLAQLKLHKQFTLLFTSALVATALFQCLVALLQYFQQHAVGLTHLGEPTLHPNFSAYFVMENGTRFLFDAAGVSKAILRAVGTFAHANILGGFMAAALLATSFLFLKAPQAKIWPRMCLSLALFLELFTLFISYSRGGLFAWGGATLIFLFLMRKQAAVVKLSLVLLIALLTSVTLLHEQLSSRGGVVNYNELAQNSDAPRLEFQQVALQLAKTHPYLGVGWNHYLLEVPTVLEEKAPAHFYLQKVHSIYFLLAAEMGFVGLGLFLLLVGSAAWQGFKQRDSLEGAFLFSLLTLFLALGLCDHYLLTHEAMRLLFFAGIGLLLSRQTQPVQEHLAQQ